MTLDFNPRPSMAERINALVDAALIAEREATPPRTYLGASRLGHACERALQFEFAQAPKDEGSDFSGQTLRIFAIGHQLEDLAIPWRAGASVGMSMGSSLMPRQHLVCAPRRSGNARR